MSESSSLVFISFGIGESERFLLDCLTLALFYKNIFYNYFLKQWARESEREQTASNRADLLSPFFCLVDENDSHSHLGFFFFLSPKGADSSSTMMIFLLRAQARAPK